jgi:hypothetical protein
MFLDHHPDTPGRKTSLKHLGYWHSVVIDSKSNGVVLKTGFSYESYEKQGGLPLPSDWVDESWSSEERAKVVAYLKDGKAVEHWRGYSFCRFGCEGHFEMGSTDLSDGSYVWPEGFSHYVEKHGVKPPEEFIQHVLREA